MGLQTMSQTRQIEDDTGEPHDVLVNYRLTTDGNDVFYTQYGKSVDAEGKNVVDEMGNWEDWAPITVNDDCQPIVNTQGLFLEDPNGTGTQCPIGGNGNDKTDPFFYHLAFGQYPTSVRDMASIYATIANDGYYHQSHFVAKVYDNTGKEVQPVNELSEGQALDKKIAQDLQWIGSEIKGESKVGEDLERDFFGKTGTWEASGEDENGEKYPAGYNAHAWYVGAIPQLSIAAWVGNLSSESDPIANPDGGFEGVTGGNTAYPVWLTAMERILDAKGDSEHWQAKEWEGKGNAGNESTWDLEKAGWNPDGEYCQANPEDTAHCGGGQEEQEQEDCEAEGGTWENDACTPADEDPGDDATPTDEPTDETTDEECPVLQPDCHEETTDPEEGATTPDDGERNNG
jgi:membrane peptidoglycan carboxypeptidase